MTEEPVIWQNDGIPVHAEPVTCLRGEDDDPHAADCIRCHGTGKQYDAERSEYTLCSAYTPDPAYEPTPSHHTDDPWSSAAGGYSDEPPSDRALALSATAGQGDAVWGGLQDNGVSLQVPKGATYTAGGTVQQLNPDGEMSEPYGGDGGDQLVNPENGCETVGEYTNLAMQITRNCGYTASDDGSEDVIQDIAPADPGARFIAPFGADTADPGYWVAGGQYIWGNTKTWDTRSGADWTQLYDTGAGHSTTALDSRNRVVWAAWCGSCNPGASFGRGIVTNYGGTWHQVTLPADFPNRYIAGITIDPSDASGKTVYAVLNGFSRHWNEGPDAGYGHIWRTTDGGATWHDISGPVTAADSFPDAPANRLLITPGGMLVVATDLGLFTSTPGATGHWKRVGLTDPSATGNLPTAAALYLAPSPDGRELYVATHGRGIWKTAMP